MVLQILGLDAPEIQDAVAMERLVCLCPPLEPNSGYAYLLLCAHFRDTCIVARSEIGLAGMIVGFRPPSAPDVLFVWQVAVHEAARGQGLGLAMLSGLVERSALNGVRFVEATVSPGNVASQGLFNAFARLHGVPCTVSPHFPAHLFWGAGHEAEDLYRIGPLVRSGQQALQEDNLL